MIIPIDMITPRPAPIPILDQNQVIIPIDMISPNPAPILILEQSQMIMLLDSKVIRKDLIIHLIDTLQAQAIQDQVVIKIIKAQITIGIQNHLTVTFNSMTMKKDLDTHLFHQDLRIIGKNRMIDMNTQAPVITHQDIKAVSNTLQNINLDGIAFHYNSISLRLRFLQPAYVFYIRDAKIMKMLKPLLSQLKLYLKQP